MTQSVDNTAASIPGVIRDPITAANLLRVNADGSINVTGGGGGSGTVTSIVIGSGLASTQSPLTTTGTLSVDGTVVALLAAKNAFTKAQTGPTAALTDAATVAWAADTIQIATLTIAGDRTLGAPSSAVVGTYVIIITQGSGGSHTLAYNAVFKWPGGVAPTLSTGAGAIDILTFVSDGTNFYGVAQLAFA